MLSAINIEYMKYIKEYYNQTSYEEISKFDYGNTPVFNELRTFTNTDAIKLDNILKRLKLKYKSKVELSNFWFLNWPIWLKSEYIDTSDINQVEWLNEWSEIFKSNIRNNESDKNPIYKDKQLYLRCQTEDKYFYQAGYRMFIVNITIGALFIVLLSFLFAGMIVLWKLPDINPIILMFGDLIKNYSQTIREVLVFEGTGFILGFIFYKKSP